MVDSALGMPCQAVRRSELTVTLALDSRQCALSRLDTTHSLTQMKQRNEVLSSSVTFSCVLAGCPDLRSRSSLLKGCGSQRRRARSLLQGRKTRLWGSSVQTQQQPPKTVIKNVLKPQEKTKNLLWLLEI